jgi:WD40 repeat protein
MVELTRLAGRGRIFRTALSSNGNFLAVISSIGVWVYDVDTLEPIGLINQPAASTYDVVSIQWSPDSTRFTTTKDKIMRIWNTHGQLLFTVDAATAAWWSPDAARLAVAQANAVQVWSADGSLLFTLKGWTAAWSPDSTQLATVTARGTGRIWNAATGQQQLMFHATVGNPNGLAWSADGHTIAISGQGVELINAATGQNRQVLDADRALSQAHWSPDGTQFIVLYDFMAWRTPATGLIVHDISTTAHLLDATDDSDWSSSINFAWSPDSHWLAIGGSAKANGLYSARADNAGLSKELEFQGAYVTWSPDGKSLAVSRNGQIDIWDPITHLRHSSMSLGTDIADNIVWSGNRLISANTTADYVLRVWDPIAGQLLRTTDAHQSYAQALTWSPDGTRIAFVDADNIVRIWDAINGRLLQSLNSHSSYILGLAWSPDGQHVISGGVDQQIHWWDIASGSEIRTLSGQWGTITSLAWSPDGKRIASAGDYRDGSIIVWDASNGQQLQVIKGDPAGASNLAWSPDSIQLAGLVHFKPTIWNEAGAHLLNLDAANAATYYTCSSVSWSPDGSLLAAGCLFGSGRTILIWNTRNYTLQRILPGEAGAGTDVVWSPDGKLLAALGDFSGRASIWDTTTWQSIKTLQLPSNGGTRVAWSPDGTRLAIGLLDGTVRIWGVPAQ